MEQPPQLIRIANISGRYLVFDPDAVSALRRRANTNGTLVGTTPQQPTQNIFLGLPIELRPEEVDALLAAGVAYVVDDVAAHRSALLSLGPDERRAYIGSLRSRKLAAHKVFAEMTAQKASIAATKAEKKKLRDSSGKSDGSSSSSSLYSRNSQVTSLGVTPTSSVDYVSPDAHALPVVPRDSEKGSLCQFMLGNGYYMTPGLRFGARYSVYPGDPLRFHAHFMANEYGWEEEIPILDIVGGGRLATAVKKAFLIGGREPSSTTTTTRPDAALPAVRSFSIEWAGM
ncbi:SEN34 subunit of tRNA-splicing endonuclease [Trichoderma citrinoviride]|uniref:tRNA-splicing endonuclease subunit Sen34 n=1 Tax=Trichoderma citrinoviride TaxID=58853 RepID=A0A2T4BP07_9HYPO|nr:SEN34 subunit of tRNA-splicing endonuclease [Trichoderma citrinoviride]PTB71020.1 SEN34 subunit of tRNA-splicing endonuclease [Trichoderma citrinoviride]